MGLQLRLQLFLPAGQTSPLRRQEVHLIVDLLRFSADGGGLCQRLLQLGDTAHAPVHPPAVEPLLQPPLRLGEGYVLLSGGHQGGDAPLQLRGGGDGQGAALSHKRGALKDLPAHSQQQLAAGIRRQAGDGLLCAGIDGGKVPEGDAPPGAPADGDVPALPLQQQFPLHRGPGPGLIAVFVRQMSLLVPVPGVDPIEHSLQKARPGGFPALIGSLDQIEARGELQPLLRQPAEGGCHPFDPHGATSSPFSRAARPKRTACWRISFSGSARHRAAIRRRNSPVRVSSSIRSHTARCTRVRSRRVRP